MQQQLHVFLLIPAPVLVLVLLVFPVLVGIGDFIVLLLPSLWHLKNVYVIQERDSASKYMTSPVPGVNLTPAFASLEESYAIRPDSLATEALTSDTIFAV